MATVETLYGSVDKAVIERFSRIRLLVCDVDGVFSDGRIYIGNAGEELKAFHTRDGFGFKAIRKSGIQTAVVTGRNSEIVSQRMQSLQTDHILQGREDKFDALGELLATTEFTTEQIAVMGDDVPDLGMFRRAGLRIAVADAHPLVLNAADYVTKSGGGFGAVREVCDHLLMVNHNLDDFSGSSS